MLLDEKESSCGVNMTPLIDVSLVLVVTLLLMTPLALESGILVRDRNPLAQEIDSGPEPEAVRLDILSENVVQVGTRTLKRENLQPVLWALLKQPEHEGVAVSCADDVSHAAFVDVLDQARLSGAGTIAITDGTTGE